MKKARLFPNSLCILCLDNQSFLASISKEKFTLRDLARFVKHKNKISHSNKKVFFRVLLNTMQDPTTWAHRTHSTVVKSCAQRTKFWKSCDRHVTASVITDGAWKAVSGSGCEPCLGFLSWKAQPDSLIYWVLPAARIRMQRVLAQESPEWCRFLDVGGSHRRWRMGGLGNSGQWLPLGNQWLLFAEIWPGTSFK